jgi:hypothetical protein
MAVGTLLGAITGGLIGLATETGVVRGTGVGGITGALVSMEVVDSSLAIWRSDEHPVIWSVVYVVSSCSCAQIDRRPVSRLPLLTESGFLCFSPARRHLEPADWPPRAREGGPRRAQRRREPGTCTHVFAPTGARVSFASQVFFRDTVSLLQMSAVEHPVGQGGDGSDIFETGGTSGMPRAAIDAIPVVRFANDVDAGGEHVSCSVCLQVNARTCESFASVICVGAASLN